MLNEVSGGRPATDTSTQCYILDVVQSIEFTSGLGKASIAFSHPTSRRGGPSVSSVTIISSDAPWQLEQHEFCYNDNFAVMLKLSGIVLLYDHDHEGGFFTSSVTHRRSRRCSRALPSGALVCSAARLSCIGDDIRVPGAQRTRHGGQYKTMLRRIAASIVSQVRNHDFFSILFYTISIFIIESQRVRPIFFRSGTLEPAAVFLSVFSSSLLVCLVTGYDTITPNACLLSSPAQSAEIDIWDTANFGYSAMFHRQLEVFSRANESLLLLSN